MASSLVSKAKKAKDHVEEGLEKVRAKPWATPLGKALQASGKVVGAVGGFVPGAKYLGGALSFGATLLYPEPTPQELQEQLREIKAALEGTSNELVLQALGKVQLELEDKIANPVGEIKVEFEEVRAEMRRIFKEVGESNNQMTEEMSRMRDLISQTFQIVLDTRFKVPSCNIRMYLICTFHCYLGQLSKGQIYCVFSGRDRDSGCSLRSVSPTRVRGFPAIRL